MLELGMMQTLALAALAVAIGQGLRRWFPVLARYDLPEPVLGGLVVALLISVLRLDGQSVVQFDTSLQTPLMVAFFTTIGFGASVRLLRIGGVQVALFLVLATSAALAQNLLGAGLAALMGLPPLFGVLAGSTTLTGGPATGLAFAPLFEQAGVNGATVVAITAAMAGIVMGGLFGGPVGGRIISRRHLRPDAAAHAPAPATAAGPATPENATAQQMRTVVLVLMAMWAGGYVAQGFKALGITLPAYIGAMLVAAVMRNIGDRQPLLRVPTQSMANLGAVVLSLFIAMALMTLQLWELVDLALPLLGLLVAQALMLVLLCRVAFRVMGGDFDAAVMAGGFYGFMMGTTANAVANMQTLTNRYGPAPRAFLVVPLVGAFFIDFVNAILITTFLNVFG
ncbi:MAG TPA: sodium/glutamate symporter [Gammaproteobacteria bacterium]|nr:sodium/glutamate symporter [Gammaproteobacteria bacterium]MCH77603.1 sodium/glutamate symporter [Gammaproteobacteria bacterium]